MKKILALLTAIFISTASADTVIRQIPSRIFQPGTYQQTSDRVPVNSTGLRITLTREAWPEGSVGRIEIWFSIDDGLTFPFMRFANLAGGTAFKKDGSVDTTSSIEMEWPQVATGPTSRQVLRGSDVKAVFIVTQALRTGITIETLDP